MIQGMRQDTEILTIFGFTATVPFLRHRPPSLHSALPSPAGPFRHPQPPARPSQLLQFPARPSRHHNLRPCQRPAVERWGDWEQCWCWWEICWKMSKTTHWRERGTYEWLMMVAIELDAKWMKMYYVIRKKYHKWLSDNVPWQRSELRCKRARAVTSKRACLNKWEHAIRIGRAGGGITSMVFFKCLVSRNKIL